MAETKFDEFKGKDCEFVAVWLKTKGLHKLCSVFEVVTLVMMLVVLMTVPNSTGSVSHEGVEVVDGSDDDCEFDEDMEPVGNSSRQSITELLRCRKPSTIREAWLLGFYDYLQTLSGKALSPKCAEQHTCQIHLMLQWINPDHDSLQAIAVWKWAKPLLDSRQKHPGTIISYQTSLEKFYKFARDKQYYTDDNFILSPPTLQQIIRNSEQMTSWRAVVRKNYNTEECRRRQKEMKTQITGEGVADIDSTEPATRALGLLKEAPKHKLSPQEFCVVRDYLVASLELQNGQHPGLLETLTMQDYEDRQTDQATGTVTVHAPCHKRSIAGPAPIAMSRSLAKKVSIYVEHVCLIFPSPDDRLFLTDSGKAFSDGTIGHRVAEFWHKTGKRSDIRMTSTRLRKMAATTTLVSSEQEKRLIHHHC